MEHERRMSSSKEKLRKSRKKSMFENKEDTVFDSINLTWKTRIRLIAFVIFACVSSVTIAGKITFTPVISHALYVHLGHKFSETQLEWIGRLYSIVVLCLVPITTSVIDYWMVSYRFSLVIAGSLHLLACITNSTVTHPLFFVLTDSLVCGLGSAITFSVFFLAIDDLFPTGNKFRVLTTTLCQGSTIFSLFLPELLAHIAKEWGWMIMQLSLAGIFVLETVMLVITCPEYGMDVRVKRRAGPKTMPVMDRNNGTVYNKILGLTFVEINKSPSMFPFLVYRFSMTIIHQGITMLLLVDSQMIINPDIETLVTKYFPTTVAAFLYATCEAAIYILGAIFGYFLLGYLLHINIALLSCLFLVTIIWQPIRLQIETQSMIIGHIICAGITGGCMGGLGTCLTSLSEEGTKIPSRRIFPFVKLLEGLAYTFAPFLFKFLNTVSDKNIWLLMFSLMAAANACLLVFILHQLYANYRAGSSQPKAAIHSPVNPAQFFVRKTGFN